MFVNKRTKCYNGKEGQVFLNVITVSDHKPRLNNNKTKNDFVQNCFLQKLRIFKGQ